LDGTPEPALVCRRIPTCSARRQDLPREAGNFPIIPKSSARFQHLPPDATIFRELDELERLIADARDGARSVIAQRDGQRALVTSHLRLLVGYVEFVSDGRMEIFALSGLEQAYASYRKSPTLSKWIAQDHGRQEQRRIADLFQGG